MVRRSIKHRVSSMSGVSFDTYESQGSRELHFDPGTQFSCLPAKIGLSPAIINELLVRLQKYLLGPTEQEKLEVIMG